MTGIAVTTSDLWVQLTVLLTALVVTTLLVLTQRWHGRLSMDHDLSGAQKIHKRPVPRVGGVAIGMGLAAGAFVAHRLEREYAVFLTTFLLCSIPAFAVGLLEDLTKRVSVRNRLVASFLSALCAAWLLGASLPKLDTPGLDVLMASAPLAVLFSCFAVGGVTNAVNIIDGVNGLASGSVCIMLAGLGTMASLEGDVLVTLLCLMGIVALLGFLALNYPFGKIFLGDGGAYLAGFWLAECAVLLLARNPEVSTWAVLLACIYPVWETAFSILRRHMVHGVASGTADMGHFHHLVLRLMGNPRQALQKPEWVRHGVTSSSLWLLTLACQIVALSGYKDSSLCATLVGTFCLAYSLSYISLSNINRQNPEGDSAARMTRI